MIQMEPARVQYGLFPKVDRALVVSSQREHSGRATTPSEYPVPSVTSACEAMSDSSGPVYKKI